MFPTAGGPPKAAGGGPAGGPPKPASGAPGGGVIGPSIVAWKAMFFGGSAAGGGPAMGAGGPGGAPGGAPGLGGAPAAVGPDIIIVPLNFEAAALGLSAVAQATHWVAVSVFGFPQFGQKTVTCVPPARAFPCELPTKGVSDARAFGSRTATTEVLTRRMLVGEICEFNRNPRSHRDLAREGAPRACVPKTTVSVGSGVS